MPAWPDLVLIDGGKGQMSAVRTILEELGIADKITAIGVAKGMDREAGRERFFMRGQARLHAAAARSGAVFRPAAARRGAPVCHRHHRARRKKEMVARTARRDCRDRADAQAGAAAPFRHRQGGLARRESTTWSRSRGFHEPWRN
jgi:hypothetical protein